MLRKPYIIAEAGCNHMGKMEIARELINTAAIYCKVDAIKFAYDFLINNLEIPKEKLYITVYRKLYFT